MENTLFLSLVINLVVLLLLILSPILSIVALIGLRRREMSPTAKGIWALVILVPFLGPIAYWIVQPEESSSHA